MSLARSASGPGGLTINTSTANFLGTSSAQQPAAGGLFGSSSASRNPAAPPALAGMAATGGVFGAAQQQKPATGLFGSSTPAATTQPGAAGGGPLGGASMTAPQNQQGQGQGTGLFGGNTNSNQQPQPQPASGGIFANTSSTTQPQQPQQPQQSSGGGLAGGLFSNTSNQQQQQQQQQPQPQQQQQQQQPAGGLFGQSSQQQQPQQAGAFFGATTANAQPATGGGLFGQPQASSGGLFGQASSQQAQSTTQIPAVQINFDNLRSRTRFDDLAQPVQQEIALIDRGIQRVIKMKDEIGEFMPQHDKDIAQLGRDVNFVESKFRTVQVVLNRDIQTVKVLQDMTKKNIADAQLSFKATDNLKLPTHYHQTGLFAGPPPPADSNATDASSAHANAQDLITYFNRICDDVERYKKRLDEYRAEIERDMPGVENGLYEQIRTFRDRKTVTGGAVQDQLGQVLSALRETGNAIVAQAGQIADTRERLSRLQAGILDSGVYTMGMGA